MSPKTARAAASSRAAWLSDLKQLLSEAQKRFADVCWCDAEGSDALFAHKAILFARSPGNLLAKYLQGQTSKTPLLSNSVASSFSGRWSNRALDSPASYVSTDSSSVAPTLLTPILLNVADRAVLSSLLSYLYTGQGAPESMLSFLFEEQLPAAQDLSTEDRLRQDLLFMWRSKLYADVQLQITRSSSTVDPEQEAIFTVHRMILLRAPYFRNLLLSAYADSANRLFTLPSPPFTPAALHFTLGWLYCGVLDFSNRTYDLTTALSIWRCATYLELDLLREEVECAIEDMSSTNPQRAARVFEWTLAPDVACPVLQESSRETVINNFGLAWRKEIGSLSQALQQDLVSSICTSIDAESAIPTLRQLVTARNATSTVLEPWAQHVQAMLEPIEARLSQIMGSDVVGIVTSASFTALLEGRSFSTDILETALELIVSGLNERGAPKAYEALVGSVLLREDGLQMDARARVEDCRKGVLKYLEKRWLSIKDLGAFDDLEPWCLKEMADELNLRPQELTSLDRPPMASTSALVRPEKFKAKAKAPAAPSTLGRGRPRISNTLEAPIVASTTTSRLRSKSGTTDATSSRGSPGRAPASSSGLRLRSNSTTSSNATRLITRRVPSQTPAVPLPSRPSSSSLRASIHSVAGSIHSGRPKTPSTTTLTPSSSPSKKSGVPRSASSATLSSPRKMPSRLSSSSLRSDSKRSVSAPIRAPPGTCLNVGIRCVVSFANGKKAIGDVLYLGPVPTLGSGSFVGLEVDETTELASGVAWTDGLVDGVRYFGGTAKAGSLKRGVFVRPKQVMYLL